MNILPLFNAAQGAATALGVILGLRRREFRTIAYFLLATTAADYVRSGLRSAFDLGTPGPYSGLRRIAFHVESALFLLWPFGVAAVAIVVLASKRARPILITYIAAVLILAASYPAIRGERLQIVYMIIHIGAILAGATCIPLWLKPSKPAKDVEHFSALWLLAYTSVLVCGPFILGAFTKWQVSLIPGILFHSMIAALSLRALYRSRSEGSRGGG
jgi:hypothetical protein